MGPANVSEAYDPGTMPKEGCWTRTWAVFLAIGDAVRRVQFVLSLLQIWFHCIATRNMPAIHTSVSRPDEHLSLHSAMLSHFSFALCTFPGRVAELERKLRAVDEYAHQSNSQAQVASLTSRVGSMEDSLGHLAQVSKWRELCLGLARTCLGALEQGSC